MKTALLVVIVLALLGMTATVAQAQCCGQTYVSYYAPACSSCGGCSSCGSSCGWSSCGSCSSCSTGCGSCGYTSYYYPATYYYAGYAPYYTGYWPSCSHCGW